MDIIRANLQKLQERIDKACERSHRSPDGITLVAVTKGLQAPAVRAASDCGIKEFGENRVQEAKEKIWELSDIKSNINWHMVGHIQSNKAQLVTELFDVIHSIDSVKLAKILNQRAQRTLPVLIQVNISGETTKEGFAIGQVTKAIEEISALPHLKITGLMTIAPLVDNPEDVRPVFRKLRQIRDSAGLEHLSMGMTDDFEVAIEEGATILRIGRAIFSNRRL